MAPQSKTTLWVGWIWFAAIMLMAVGLFNAISGLVAVFSPNTWIAASGGQVVVLDVSAWGWVHLILGALIVTVSVFLFQGKTWARVTAIVLVALNALAQFATMLVTPWWSIIVIVLDFFILWALVVHGDEVNDAARSL